jgi:hypothetical protein
MAMAGVVMKIDSIEAFAQVHIADARFFADGWRFDRAARRFSMQIWQPDYHDSEYILKFLWLHKRRTPWRASILTFDEVIDVSVSQTGHTDRIEYFELSSMAFDSTANQIKIATHYVISFTLTVTRLLGSFDDTSESS